MYLKGGHSSNLIEHTFVDADVFNFILALRSVKISEVFYLGEGENGGSEAESHFPEVIYRVLVDHGLETRMERMSFPHALSFKLCWLVPAWVWKSHTALQVPGMSPAQSCFC